MNYSLLKKDTCLLCYPACISDPCSSTVHLSPVVIVQTDKDHFKSTQVSLNIKEVQSDTAKPLFPASRYSLLNCTL